MYQQSERSLDRVLKLETTQITNTFTITTRYDSTKNRTRNETAIFDMLRQSMETCSLSGIAHINGYSFIRR